VQLGSHAWAADVRKQAEHLIVKLCLRGVAAQMWRHASAHASCPAYATCRAAECARVAVRCAESIHNGFLVCISQCGDEIIIGFLHAAQNGCLAEDLALERSLQKKGNKREVRKEKHLL